METPDSSQYLDSWILVKLMRPVATLLGCLALLTPVAKLSAATVEYDLTIARQEMNFTMQMGKESMAQCPDDEGYEGHG